jgi:hypothetical protein
MTTPNLEARMARVEGSVEQINLRLGRIEALIDQLRGELNALRGELNTRFYILLGTLIPMWVTIILAILLLS